VTLQFDSGGLWDAAGAKWDQNVPQTAYNLIALALFDAGILGTGQAMTGQDASLALLRLNFMLQEWKAKRWLVYHTVDTGVVSTGAQSYTVGPGGAFNLPDAPDRLEAAFFRQLTQSQPNQIDYPLDLLQSREDYNNIALKQLASFPQNVFYDSSYPLGNVFYWPIPQASIYELHITTKEVLQDIPNPNSPVILPKVYNNAIHWNLAVRYREAYGLAPRPGHVALAKTALSSMRKANTQIARLTLPQDLARPGIYNPYSDQVR
jgi:hypothetical protein